MFFNKNTIQQFPLQQEGNQRYLPWVMGSLTVLVILITACFLSFDHPLKGGIGPQSPTLTVEIPFTDSSHSSFQETTQKVLTVLQELPHLENVRVIPKQELLALLDPWLGDTEDIKDLDLPILIDVTFTNPEALDVADLTQRLRQITAGIRVETHSHWQGLITNTYQAIEMVSMGLILFVFIVLAVVMSLVTRASVVAYRSIIDTLRLMGAKNSFIAKQFQSHMYKSCLQGGFVGWAGGIGLVFFLNNLPQLLGHPLVVASMITWQNVCFFAFLPIVMAVFSVLITRITVTRLLRLFDQ